MGVLSRLLREDRGKSPDLILNIAYIFFAFSIFSDFHPLVMQHQIGNYTMKIIEWEMGAFKFRNDEIKQADDRKKASKKLTKLTRKQEKLLTVCFHILLNFAEDVSVEKKMKKRHITSSLVTMLDRRSVDLQLLVITFLKKLSIFGENKNDMAKENVIPKLVKFTTTEQLPLLDAALRLMNNLAFDAQLRDKLAEHSIVPRLMDLLKRGVLVQTVLRLLYQISCSERALKTFRFVDGLIPFLLKTITGHREPSTKHTALALAINLATDATQAAELARGSQFKSLLQRALSSQDPILLKLVRNIALTHAEARRHLAGCTDNQVVIARSTDDSDVLVEIIGSLASLTADEVDWQNLCTKYELTSNLNKFLVPGFVEDDIVLEVIMLVGSIAGESECSQLISHSNLVRGLYTIFSEDDDDMLAQLCWTFYMLMRHEDTRNIILDQTHVVEKLIELLMPERHPLVSKMADTALDVVMEADEELAVPIKQRKFQVHNREWLAKIDQDDGGSGGQGGHDQYYYDDEVEDNPEDISAQMRMQQELFNQWEAEQEMRARREAGGEEAMADEMRMAMQGGDQEDSYGERYGDEYPLSVAY